MLHSKSPSVHPGRQQNRLVAIVRILTAVRCQQSLPAVSVFVPTRCALLLPLTTAQSLSVQAATTLLRPASLAT